MLTNAVFIFVIVLLIRSLLKWVSRKRSINCTFSSLGIPGPPPTFLTGNFPDYVRKNLSHETLNRWAKQYGPVFGYYQGENPVVVLSDADDVHEVLVKLGRSFSNRKKFIVTEPFLSSLIGLRGEKWRKSRSILSPPFTAHKIALDTSKSTINKAVSRMMDFLKIKQTQNNELINVKVLMQCVTQEIISKFAFNATEKQVDDFYTENSKQRQIIGQFMDNQSPNFVFQLMAYFPFFKWLAALLYNIFGGGKFINHIVKHVKKCVLKYNQKRVSFFDDMDSGKTQNSKKVNILDYMLKQQELGNLNQNELMGNAIVAFIAGYETTSNSLTFTFYLLAKHPDIQEKLRTEILEEMNKNAQQDSPTNFCHFDSNRCELLDRVWYESLRLYPPLVTFTTRELDDDLEPEEVVLTKSKVKITKNIAVEVPTWTIHHSAQYWEKPYVFNPSRKYLPIPGSGLTNYAFLPYGAGPRSCIGSKLADTEARAVLSALISSYQVELTNDGEEKKSVDPVTGLLKLTCNFLIIKPEKNIYLKFTPV